MKAVRATATLFPVVFKRYSINKNGVGRLAKVGTKLTYREKEQIEDQL